MQTREDVLAHIRRHGEETYPEECCGFLIGRLHADGNEAVYARRAVNRNENRREDRYIIAPGEYLEADLAARRENMDIVGIYHSHPDCPTVPSRTDVELATFPGYAYVIVSVENGKATNLSAWALAEDRSRFMPEEIDVHAASKKS